jgi:hypothetical protein
MIFVLQKILLPILGVEFFLKKSVKQINFELGHTGKNRFGWIPELVYSLDWPKEVGYY